MASCNRSVMHKTDIRGFCLFRMNDKWLTGGNRGNWVPVDKDVESNLALPSIEFTVEFE